MTTRHPSEYNTPGEETIGIDELSLEQAAKLALENEPMYRGPMFSVEDIIRLIIRTDRALSPAQMAAAMGINRVTIAGPLNRAVNAGLLRRSGSGGRTKYHITDAGRELIVNRPYNPGGAGQGTGNLGDDSE